MVAGYVIWGIAFEAHIGTNKNQTVAGRFKENSNRKEQIINSPVTIDFNGKIIPNFHLIVSNILENKGKESENSYQKVKISRWQAHENRQHTS